MDKGDEVWCTGCGCTDTLSHSHLIPRSKRRDLITDPKNITFHCDACHDIWEHGALLMKKTLKDFERNMEYIKETDPQYYKQLILKE